MGFGGLLGPGLPNGKTDWCCKWRRRRSLCGICSIKSRRAVGRPPSHAQPPPIRAIRRIRPFSSVLFSERNALVKVKSQRVTDGRMSEGHLARRFPFNLFEITSLLDLSVTWANLAWSLSAEIDQRSFLNRDKMIFNFPRMLRHD